MQQNEKNTCVNDFNAILNFLRLNYLISLQVGKKLSIFCSGQFEVGNCKAFACNNKDQRTNAN